MNKIELNPIELNSSFLSSFLFLFLYFKRSPSPFLLLRNPILKYQQRNLDLSTSWHVWQLSSVLLPLSPNVLHISSWTILQPVGYQYQILISKQNQNANEPPDGFNDDAEGNAPCGGFSVAFDKNVTDFHIDGDSIAMLVS